MRCFIFFPGKQSERNCITSCKGNQVSDMKMYASLVSSYICIYIAVPYIVITQEPNTTQFCLWLSFLKSISKVITRVELEKNLFQL
jgi:hypothetical protein